MSPDGQINFMYVNMANFMTLLDLQEFFYWHYFKIHLMIPCLVALVGLILADKVWAFVAPIV